MKRIINMVSLCIIGVILVSCHHDYEANTANSNMSFDSDLYSLANKDYNLFNATKSEGYYLNGDGIDMIIADAKSLCEKYNLSEEFYNSGYYQDIRKYESMQSAEINCLDVILDNSTPAFQRGIINVLTGDEEPQLESILNNDSLLSSEKIALAIILNLKNCDDYNSQVTKSSDCRSAYESSMKVCKNWMYAGVGLTVVSVAVSPWLSAAFAGATTIDYDNCSSKANSALMDCLGM